MQGHGLREREAILDQMSLEFAQLLLGGLLPVEAQNHPLQQVDQRVQGGVLVVGRTLTRCEPGLGLSGHLLRQHLHQARFADAGFTAEEHDLSEAVFDLGPALAQHPDFLLPTHQRGPPGAAGGFRRLRAILS